MPKLISFIIFILFAITIYSFLNFYFIKKHKNVLTLNALPLLLFRLILITIILTPIATIIFSYNNIPLGAAVTGFTGYSWMAFLFLFLIIHGTADLILYFCEKFGYKPARNLARMIFGITMFLSISIMIYGYFEAKQIRIEEITIETDKLPRKIKQMKIVQVSDIHFSPMISVDTARKITNLIKEQDADIIISTGDLLDPGVREAEKVINILNSLRAPLGKFAVTGNHEFISNINTSVDFTEKAGFTLLRNRSITIAGAINLVGIDDLSAERFGIKINKTEIEALKNIDISKYTILLKHQPRVTKKNTPYYDLQLSGHTHAGQIFPFTLITKIIFPYLCGMYQVNNHTKIYVNRGAGTWGPPIRFLAPPEITVIKLKNKFFDN